MYSFKSTYTYTYSLHLSPSSHIGQVSSTETGIIFGNIVYDVSSAGSDRNVVVLNDIHIDIMVRSLVMVLCVSEDRGIIGCGWMKVFMYIVRKSDIGLIFTHFFLSLPGLYHAGILYGGRFSLHVGGIRVGE